MLCVYSSSGDSLFISIVVNETMLNILCINILCISILCTKLTLII